MSAWMPPPVLRSASLTVPDASDTNLALAELAAVVCSQNVADSGDDFMGCPAFHEHAVEIFPAVRNL
jgi:hypothetical protein